MDEPTQPYHEIRALLADLVASWQWDRPGTAFEKAKIYLDFHCAGCGAKLSVNDLAVVLEREMLRLGTVDGRKVPYYAPICACCYIKRNALECAAQYQVRRSLTQGSAGLLANTSDTCSAQGDQHIAHLIDVQELWHVPSSPTSDGYVRAAGHPKSADGGSRHISCVWWSQLHLPWESLVVMGLLLMAIALALVWFVFHVGILTISLHRVITITPPDHVGLLQTIRLFRYARQRPA